MSSIIFNNNNITKIKYSGYTITKVYACGGELVYSGDTSSDNVGRIKFQETARSSDTATTSCVTSFTDISTRFKPNVFEFTISGDTVCGLRANDVLSGVNLRKIQSVSLPGTTRTVDYNAFYKHDNYVSGSVSGTVIVLNDGLEYIRSSAFRGIVTNTQNLCPTLVIPATVKEIEYDAFNFDDASFGSQTNVTSRWYNVVFKGSTPPTMGSMFGNGGVQPNRQITLYVPQGTASAYRDALPARYKQTGDEMAIVEYTSDTLGYRTAMNTYNDYITTQGL